MGDTLAGGGDTTQVPGAEEVFGRYRLLSLLGEGGMGQVWRAHDSQTNRVVALKVLPTRSADDETLRQRFRRECRAVAQLTEPHVIPIHDFGDIEGRLFLNMRLVEGTDLRSVISSEGVLPPARAVVIVSQVAGALQAAHDVGLVHRDVKPSNILLGADDFAYLIDFGIAHAANDHSLTSTGQTIGTLSYMAPEAIGAAVTTDSRVDVYALACVLFECLTGRPPFSSTSGIPALMYDHMHTPPPRPSTANTDVPVGFDAVIAKGMAKDPDDRYQTVRELVAAARASVGDSADPELGQATTDWAPAARHKRRIRLSRKATGIVAAALVVVVVAAVAIAVWGTRGGSTRPEQGTATPSTSEPNNPNNLTADEIDLLKHAFTELYNRASCRHLDTRDVAKAGILCGPVLANGAPLGAFYSFDSPSKFRSFFSTYRDIVGATSCPGDPPGPDGPAKDFDGKEVGRRACYLNKTATAPLPATIVTHESTLVIADFVWTGPAGAEGLYSFTYGLVATDGGLRDEPSDPDFFTPADLDLLSLLSRAFGARDGYTKVNCRHTEPLTGGKAGLVCSSNPETGYANVFVYGYDDLGPLQRFFDAGQAQSKGCDEPATLTSETWFLNGHQVGRYTCFMDTTGANPIPAILATNEDNLWTAEFHADHEGFPYPTPQNEQQLLDWFKRASG